ncbi:unnamed protein product, partial [Mesorhabditis spiculigera]
MKLIFWIFASLMLLLVDAEPMFPAIPKDESQLCLTIEDCPQTRGKLSHICDIPYGELEGVVLFSQPNSSDIGLFCYPNMANVQTMADLLQVEVYAYDYSGFIHVQVGPDTTSERQTVVSKVSRPSLYMHLLNVFAEGAQKARRSGDANAANGSSQKTSSSSGSPQEEAA